MGKAFNICLAAFAATGYVCDGGSLSASQETNMLT